MIDTNYITVAFTIFAFVLFAFIYWRDSTSEGFGSDQILDSFVVILLGGLIGGKLLFREINIDFFRYQLMTMPLILEGILVGGGIAGYIEIKRHKWDAWKIGDMLAPALAIFQAVLFLGFWFRAAQLSSFLIFVAFLFLYLFIRALKKYRQLGSSIDFFLRKRLNMVVISGVLFNVYLTGSSLIAILFLLTHINKSSVFWRFQLTFYISILVASYLLMRRRLNKQGVKMNPVSTFTVSFLNKVKGKLSRRKKKIELEEKNIEKEDPFMQEYKTDGFRNLDDIGEEAADFTDHEDLKARKEVLEIEEKEIKDTLKDIKEGTYGICEVCGKKISKERLGVYPTATTCIECANK